jgi:hypothetical protein
MRYVELYEGTIRRLEEVSGFLGERRIRVNHMGAKRLTQGKKRAAAHRRAMGIFASLPQLEDPDYVRNAMWRLRESVLPGDLALARSSSTGEFSGVADPYADRSSDCVAGDITPEESVAEQDS